MNPWELTNLKQKNNAKPFKRISREKNLKNDEEFRKEKANKKTNPYYLSNRILKA